MNGGNTGAKPDDTGRILVRRLRKQFGPVEAVRDLSFTVEPGRVTGFLGPNGAGKTTTLRIAVGLVRPNDGEVTINGVRYEQLAHPARVVGAVLDSQGFHRSRRARAHLRAYAAAIGVPDQRVNDVLTLVGLTDAADRKVGGYSLGMRQRLALATALLGDPPVLILDEPGAGLDPEGVAWLRGFLRSFAASGRTVLVSSHQLAEIEQTVDHVVIISQGALVFEGRVDQLGVDSTPRLQVQCADQAQLASALAERGITDIQALPDGSLAVGGTTSTTVGQAALAAGVAIYGIAEQRADLERRFFELTSGQYQPSQSYVTHPYAAQPNISAVPPAGPPSQLPPPAAPQPGAPNTAPLIPTAPVNTPPPGKPASGVADQHVPQNATGPQVVQPDADVAPARSAADEPAQDHRSAQKPAPTGTNHGAAASDSDSTTDKATADTKGGTAQADTATNHTGREEPDGDAVNGSTSKHEGNAR